MERETDHLKENNFLMDRFVKLQVQAGPPWSNSHAGARVYDA